MTNKPWTLERAAVLARQILQFVAVPGEEPGETRPPMTAVWSQMLNDVEQLEAVASSCVAAGAEDSKRPEPMWSRTKMLCEMKHPGITRLTPCDDCKRAARQGEGTNG